jgi:hypothetical protein
VSVSCATARQASTVRGEAEVVVVERKFWVKLIDRGTLLRYMDFRGFTVRSLAEAVDREVKKHDKKTVSTKSAIGHLRSGERSTVQPWTARAIEKCLECPPGSLFVAEVSHVSRPQRTAA